MITERERLTHGLSRAQLGTRRFLAGLRLSSLAALISSVTIFALVLVSSVFITDSRFGRLLAEVSSTTHGWIAEQLVYPLLALGLMWLVFLRDGLRWKDLGWNLPDLVGAMIVTVLLWVFVQASVWMAGIAEGRPVALHFAWRGQEGAPLAGFGAQLFGNALTEETLFRGYVLPQVFLRIARVASANVALVVAFLGITAFAALLHVPVLVHEGGLTGEALASVLSWTAMFEAVLALVFLVTRNLFVRVGLHASWNAMPELFDAPGAHYERAWWLGVILLVSGWMIHNCLSSATRRDLCRGSGRSGTS
ncbi:MAG: CPBP family intramembrane metalloprotease [Planctomycetes bacterium]|nr:CPBP family intramembrane metalloprotease [Planctomycetota bacterium]